MKKIKKMTAYFLIGSISFSSCIGPFKLTNTLFAWNETIGSKWKNELIFLLFIIIPVYEIALLIDGLIINSVEFWSNDIGFGLKEGESKKLTSKDGKSEYLITKSSDGFNIKQTAGLKEGVDANFKFDESEMTWYFLSKNEPIKLAQLVIGPDGDFVRIFRPDGTSAMLDASLRNIDTIKEMISRPSLSL